MTVLTTPADHWRALLRTHLLTARKNRDAVRVSALRSALAAIDNAETPGAETPGAENLAVAPTSTTVAGAVDGLGAAEVARKVLTDDEIRALVFAEIAERRAAAQALPSDHAAAQERAGSLLAEAQALADIAYQDI